MSKIAEEDKVALVTGASSGIGLEFCQLLAAEGYTLIVVARREAALNELARDLRTRYGVIVHVQAWDLSQPDAGETLWRTLVDRGLGRIDFLVNNAGIGQSGPFAHCDLAECQRMILTNVLAPTELARCVVPGMLERRFGRIMNVASLAAFQPGGPGMAAYYATKAYVLAWSRGMSRELSGSGVRVTALCPGPTRTEFEHLSGAENQRLFRWFKPMSARSVAVSGYRAMKWGRTAVVPGWFNKLLAFGGELPPRRIAMEVNRLFLTQ